MRKTYAELRDQTSYDSLICSVREDFGKIPDHRASNVVYKLQDVLLSGYALFALKYPSMHRFEQQSEIEKENLKNLFGIEKVISDAQMRRVLDEVNPDQLFELFSNRVDHLKSLGVLSDYRFLKNYLLVPIDGVHHFESKKVKCKRCTVKQHRNGTTSYNHSMLGATLVHPQRKEVFPIGCEAIEKQDGSRKNDCELNAAKRLLKKLYDAYKGLKMLLVEDALYANEPHIKQILDCEWDYIISVKPKSHKTLFAHFEARRQRDQVKSKVIKEGKITHHFYWMNNVVLNENGNVRTNMLYYEEHHENGKVKIFSWVTSLKLRQSNIYEIMRGGRARWKIENETFNTLKNQGYNFEHNYGHGYNHLANIMANLMFLAFTIDQIVQAFHRIFGKVWKKVKTKSTIWEYFRAIYLVRIVKSFKELFRILARSYKIQLE